MQDKQEIQKLQQELSTLNLRIAEARRQEKKQVLASIKAQVEEYGISNDEVLRVLGILKPLRQPAPDQYYDPSSGRKWSGKGRRPAWLQGKNLEDYRIDRAPKLWWPGEDA